MDRKDFLNTVWKKGIKPIFLIGIIFFCGKFIYAIFTENGTERFAVFLILGLGILILTIHLIEHLFHSLLDKVRAILPKPFKFWLSVIGKFLNYISPIIFGMIIYRFWKEDWIGAAIVLGILFTHRIVEIIKEEKAIKQ